MPTSRSLGSPLTPASHLLGCFAVNLILILPGFAALRLEAGGSSFTPQQKSAFWLSNEGNYTFGFKDVGYAGGYLLSIWHSTDPNQTALWWANFGDDPIVQDGATFRYTSTGSLELRNGSSMLWSSNTISSYAELQDSGNLRLLQENNVSIAWQSFGDPRDSLMLVGFNDQEEENRPNLLQSRRNQSSYAAGTFHLATDGYLNVYLHGLDAFNNDYVYLIGNMSSNGGFQIGRNNGKHFASSNPAADRLTLDDDGNLRVYRWESNVSSWQAVWQFLDDKCMLGSPCGPFGICNMVDGAQHCSCPPGYDVRVSGDISHGCVNNNISFNASCGLNSGSSNYSTTNYSTTIIEMPNSDYEYNDLPLGGYNPNVSLRQCKTLCFNNCECMAASYRIDNTCFLKGNSTTGYLLNGYATDNNTLLIKVVTTTSTNASPHGVKGVIRLIGFGLASVLVAAVIVGCAWLLWCGRNGGIARSTIMQWTLGKNEEPDPVFGTGLVRFRYQELVKATNNFSEPLGEGGFGKVYKGWVKGKRGIGNTASEHVAVAVKVLKLGSTSDEEGGEKEMGEASKGEKQFTAEVTTLGKIHHINLVSLLGHCTGGPAGEKRLLVYEYMEKGSLDRFLSAANVQRPLAWATRYSIAVGTARGIAYLHHGCSPHILHCDIKPQNVLLDHNFSAKVADFGFARFFLHRDSHLTMSGMRGTRGYMAPEWLISDEVTSKVDVYSFGMLLLELVHSPNKVNDSMPLQDWAFQCISAGVVLSQKASHSDDDINVDKSSRDVPSPQQDDQQDTVEKLRVLKVGIWCVQPMPSMRPSMSRVVQLLEGTVAVEDPPNPAPIITITNLPSFLSESDPSACSNVNSYSVLSPR